MEPRGIPPEHYFACKIVERENSDAFRLVREAVLESGLIECNHAVIPKELGRSHFSFQKLRIFPREDLDRAPYLRLNVKGLQRLADWKETTPDGYMLRLNHRLKNRRDFGWLDVVIVPYVSEEGRTQLEADSIKGVRFEPAIYETPAKTGKKLYQLTSTMTMPPCLVPIQNGRGEVVRDETGGGGRVWDDSGYIQPILKFRRAEVKALEPFDYARTAERIGGLPQFYRHQYAVSQRFRRFIEAKKVHAMDFVPVELVD